MVASYYSGEVLSLDPNRCQVIKRMGLGEQPAPDTARHGEFVFHDGRHSFQHWLSCATCHPDGRADGLNWDLLNDGIGNPKNAHSLLWSDRTPPLMSLGIRENMEEATQKGFQFIQFREIEEGDLNAVRAYLRSMEPEASPLLVGGRLSEEARKGQRIFEECRGGLFRVSSGPPVHVAQDPRRRHEIRPRPQRSLRHADLRRALADRPLPPRRQCRDFERSPDDEEPGRQAR